MLRWRVCILDRTTVDRSRARHRLARMLDREVDPQPGAGHRGRGRGCGLHRLRSALRHPNEAGLPTHRRRRDLGRVHEQVQLPIFCIGGIKLRQSSGSFGRWRKARRHRIWPAAMRRHRRRHPHREADAREQSAIRNPKSEITHVRSRCWFHRTRYRQNSGRGTRRSAWRFCLLCGGGCEFFFAGQTGRCGGRRFSRIGI